MPFREPSERGACSTASHDGRRDYIRNQVLGGRQSDGNFGNRVQTQLSEHRHQHKFEHAVEFGWRGFGVEHTIPVFALRDSANNKSPFMGMPENRQD